MNGSAADMRENMAVIVLLSVIPELVLKRRSLCRLFCAIKAGKLTLREA